ncbi:MAG: archease [Candidatus Omnitrophica bacterium]|nr:archease [Candidatus Omnitrophota bacterium]
MKPFERIEHTADAGLAIYGKTLEELFANGAQGMTSIMAEGVGHGIPVERHIRLPMSDVDDVFLKWLREILFLFSRDKFLFSKITKFDFNDRELSADIEGEILDPKRHGLGLEIKAVTYHDFSLVETPKGFEARVIFDV